MGAFWCELCQEYWYSFNAEAIGAHNVKHEQNLRLQVEAKALDRGVEEDDLDQEDFGGE